MSKAVVPVVYEVEVMFGDCDPAGIVFFPNFSKWMDASSLNFFVQPHFNQPADRTAMLLKQPIYGLIVSILGSDKQRIGLIANGPDGLL